MGKRGKSNELMRLADGVNRQGSALPSISPDGKLVYVVYSDTEANISEFFENQDGKLIFLRGIVKDPNFPDTQSGYANPKFTRFTLLDSNENFLTGRIRLFDNQYNVLAERVFNNAFDFLGGAFSANGKYIGLTFINQLDPQISVLEILETKKLTTVASTTFATHSNGPQFLQHGDKTYIVVASGNSGANPPEFAPPAQVNIYKLSCNKLVFKDSQALPQFPHVTAALNTNDNNCNALILVGTNAAFLQNEKGLAIDTSNFQSFLPLDGDEVSQRT